MRRLIVILLTLISIQSFSQVKEISPDEFRKLDLNKSLVYDGEGNFFEIRTHFVSWMRNKFHLIKIDTITNQLHIAGKISSSRTSDKFLSIEINVGEVISEDKNGMKMRFTHYFYTDKEGNYDISFIINNENTLLSFNRNETSRELKPLAYSKIYQVGELLK